MFILCKIFSKSNVEKEEPVISFVFCSWTSRATISVKFKTENSKELHYKPGDHVAIFPANRPELVQALIDKLADDVDPDQPIVVEAQREDKGKRSSQCA